MSLGGGTMTKTEAATLPIAAGALAYPTVHAWIEWLSGEAKIVLPILGATWLLVQIMSKIYVTWMKGRR